MQSVFQMNDKSASALLFYLYFRGSQERLVVHLPREFQENPFDLGSLEFLSAHPTLENNRNLVN